MPSLVRTLTFLPLIALAILASTATAQEAPLDLRPKFHAGQVSRFEVWTLRDQSTTVNFNGQSHAGATRMEINGEVTWAVERVNADGGATCSMTLDWITVALTTPDGATMRCDSRRATGDNEQVQRMIRAMATVPVKVEVGADGTILSASGGDAVRRRAGAELKTPDDLDFMESASDLATIPGSPAAAKPGASWEQAFVWNHDLGKTHENMRYRLASVEEIAGIPVATVWGSSSIHLDVDPAKLHGPAASGAAGASGAPAPKIDIRMTSGSTTTQIMFDLQRHEAVGRNTTQESQIESKVRLGVNTLTSSTHETIQSQALRIEER